MKRPPRIQRRRKPNHDVDMTPMIDVVFLLLIFFVMAASFTVRGLDVELPPAKTSEPVAGRVVKWELTQDGVFRLDGIVVSAKRCPSPCNGSCAPSGRIPVRSFWPPTPRPPWKRSSSSSTACVRREAKSFSSRPKRREPPHDGRRRLKTGLSCRSSCTPPSFSAGANPFASLERGNRRDGWSLKGRRRRERKGGVLLEASRFRPAGGRARRRPTKSAVAATSPICRT